MGRTLELEERRVENADLGVGDVVVPDKELEAEKARARSLILK